MPAVMKPADEPPAVGTPTLFWLDIGTGRAFRANADGSGAMQFASGRPLSGPDGVTVDVENKHVFILNMGANGGGTGNASLVRYNLDGTGAEVIVPSGSMADGQLFNTGKQVTLDRVNKKLYMGDREGSKVWRCDLDGKNLEVLVSGHGIQQVVGVAVDPGQGHFYFSDRNGDKLFRAKMKMPDGKTHATRDDLELLYYDRRPNAMPLDLEVDLKTRTLFWTDRDQNKVFSMGMDIPAGQDAMTRTDVKDVASNLNDVIGLGYDHQDGVLYVTHLKSARPGDGAVSRVKPDGSGLQRIAMDGTTGIAFARIP
jgi:sugar lactone lactonase YvrE